MIKKKLFRVFSRQQYFDSKGLFISIVFSVPILMNCMIMVVSVKKKIQFINLIKKFTLLSKLNVLLL